MKKKQTIWFILMLCWWGLLFPELTFTEDSLRAVYTGASAEDEMGEEYLTEEALAKLEQSQWDTYVDFLHAEPEQVKIKSRLLEILSDLWK